MLPAASGFAELWTAVVDLLTGPHIRDTTGGMTVLRVAALPRALLLARLEG